jgi:tryptophan synthase beta subunit
MRSAESLPKRFGEYGGQYVPETLIPALGELEREWLAARDDPGFEHDLDRLLRDYAGRRPCTWPSGCRRSAAARCT